MRAHETSRSWRKNKGRVCPSCKVTSEDNSWAWKFRDGDFEYNRCLHCGSLYHQSNIGRSGFLNAAKRFGPRKLEELYACPAWMGADEFAFRLELCRIYLTKPFGEYRRQLEVFADFLGDQGSPEEAAARADWRPRGLSINTAWARDVNHYQIYNPALRDLVVRVADGWWESLSMTERVNTFRGPIVVAKVRAQKRFGIPTGPTNQSHNGDWFLGWPPGWVKFTQPADEPKWWWVTVEPGRSLVHSAPIEHKRDRGYTEFFHAPNALEPLTDKIPGTV